MRSLYVIRSKRWPLLLAVGIGLYACDAMAAISSGNILDSVTTQFYTQASLWGGIITGYATWLFWMLGTISLVWTGGTLTMKRADIGEFFAELVRFILFFGFFLWLLQNAPAIGTAIIHSLIQIGAKASQTGVSNPSAVMDIGFNIFHKVMEQTSVLSPVDSMIGAVLAGIILICIALIAANMTIMLCSAWILLYGGIFFLGFGGSRWTSDIAINYYKALLSVGVSLMVMILMVGIAQSIVTNYYNQMSTGIQVTEIATIMVVAIILLLLIHRVPSMVSGVLTGATISGSGIGSYGAATGIAAAGVAALGAGAVASSAARNIGGAGQAIASAYQNAQQNMATSRDANPSSSGGGLASAMGNGTSMMAEMGKSLASGIGGALKQAATSMKDKASAASSDSFLGRVSSHIQSEIASNAQSTAMPNAISPGSDSSTDEIAAFVNKTGGAS